MSAALDITREALREERAWLVGGAVRDRLLGREVQDLDIVIAGDVRAAARHLALTAGGPAFELSDAFGAWRVMEAAKTHAPGIASVAQERVFAELRRMVVADAALRGLALMDDLALTPVVLPELHVQRGVEQTPYHHRDVHGHTLEVMQAVIDLERDPGAVLGARFDEPGR